MAIQQEWKFGGGKSGNKWFSENYRSGTDGGAKKMKKQTKADKRDESLGMRTSKESTKKQSFKDRRDESYGIA